MDENSIRPALSVKLEVMLVRFACLTRSAQDWALGLVGIHITHTHFHEH